MGLVFNPLTNKFDVSGDNDSLTGTLDHGTVHTALSLGDDDHPHYLLADGTRDLAGDWNAGAYSITILSDSKKFICGAGSDMSFYYNGTNGYINTNEVAASDLYISCGTDKTLVLTESGWDDLNFDIVRAGGPTSTLPDNVTINNVLHKEFTSANNQFCGSSQEVPHPYKLSTNLLPHVHIFLKASENAGATGVTFTFYWELRQPSGVTSGSVALTATSAQLTANPSILLVHDDTGFAGPSVIGGQLAITLARTAGNAGDVVVTTYGVHHEIDTPGGSRQSTVK